MEGDADAPEGCRQRPDGWWAHRLAAHAARCGAIPGVGGQDAMVSDEVEARRRHQGGEFLYQFQWRQDEKGRTVRPRLPLLQCDSELLC